MHLDEHDIARYLDGEMTPEEKTQAERHLAGCASCSEMVGSVARVQQTVHEGDEPALEPSTLERAERVVEAREAAPAPSRPRWGYAIAASIVVALAVGLVQVFWEGGEAPSSLRSAGETQTVSVQAPRDGATVRQAPTFQWGIVDGAVAYRLTLYARDGQLLWSADTTATQLTGPAPDSLTTGQRYLWEVEALLTNGATLRSDVHTFRYVQP